MTNRIAAQAGCFTIHPAESTSRMRRWPGKVVKFRVPASSKFSIAVELASIGIHFASLFPDLDGLSRHLNAGYFPGMGQVVNGRYEHKS